ncbi:hypothetical protein [Bradymonas sediminis]|nr:hypothetical protein [Bradymonas sediminis]TDP76805.1 hypothetical protein DFR33_102442 [Bradymonas sediminis]
MSKDTQNFQRSAAADMIASTANADQTVEIPRAELAAIRQSASLPEITAASRPRLAPRRVAEKPRDRESTPQFVDIAQTLEASADNDPTLSFKRKSIEHMLKQDQPAMKIKKMAAKLRSAAQAKSAHALSTRPMPPVSAPSDQTETLEQAPPLDFNDESLAFLDDGMLHNIVFSGAPPHASNPGGATAARQVASQRAPEAFNAPEPPKTRMPGPARAKAPPPSLPTFEPTPVGKPAEISLAPPAQFVLQTNDALIATPPESQTSSDACSAPSKNAHPLVILCAVLGMLGIVGAVAGLVFPDARFALSPTRQALILAAGALLLYLSALLRR